MNTYQQRAHPYWAIQRAAVLAREKGQTFLAMDLAVIAEGHFAPEAACPSCNGSGREWDPGSEIEPPCFTGEDCTACAGTGLATLEPSEIEIEASDANAELMGVG